MFYYTVRVLAPKVSLGVLILAVLAVAGTGEAQRRGRGGGRAHAVTVPRSESR